jgi:urease accessory protein
MTPTLPPQPTSLHERITVGEFVTPPEFVSRELSPVTAGRVGGVRLELNPASCARTSFGRCYQQVPLRVLPPFQLGKGQPSLIYLLNPTAGLLDGDGHLVELTARAGVRAVIVGQSATRIHPCLHRFATQQWRIRVEAGAALVVLPGPSIPFVGCRYYQRVTVDLDPGAVFAWGDIGYSGRYARAEASERFQFDVIVQELTVRRAGRPVFRDRCCWRGPWDPATAEWHFGRSGDAWGTLFTTVPVLALNETDRPGAATFATAAGDVSGRWTGSAEQVTADVVRAALHWTSDPTARLSEAAWLNPTLLAPAHWFSAGCATP